MTASHGMAVMALAARKSQEEADRPALSQPIGIVPPCQSFCTFRIAHMGLGYISVGAGFYTEGFVMAAMGRRLELKSLYFITLY